MKDRFRAEDDGMVTILVIGCLVFAMGLVFVVASATAVHLERKQLAGLADSLAVSAANSEVDDGFFQHGGTDDGPRQLSQSEVEQAVSEHLADNPHGAGGLNITSIEVSVNDGDTAVVRLRAHVHPPLTGWILEQWSAGITITAESRARTW